LLWPLPENLMNCCELRQIDTQILRHV
jgi:hypothetical protein